jgi:F-box-like
MMLCDKCLSPVQFNLLSESDTRLGTDNSELVSNLSHHFLDRTNIYLKKVADLVQFGPSTAQLAQRRMFLRRKINELSPTARIPTDILIEIFQVACKPVYHSYGSSQAVTPLFIGSICRQWRDVAWSTPLLWSTIFLHVSREHHDTQIQLLGEWLLNAKSAPLSIKLTTYTEGLEENESVLCAFEAIVRILITRSDQWLTFDSRLPPPQCRNILKNIDFPMLTSVSLCPASTPITPEMFLSAPKLVDITLRRYNFPVVLPWEQIKRFRMGRSSFNRCLKILQQLKSPNLEECHFEGVYLQHGITSEAVGVHAYAQLKHLHVKLDNSWCISLFNNITLPSLSDLGIQYNGNKRLPLSSIRSLLLRSACNLERLTIQFPFDDTDLILCLEVIPSLSYLHLETMGDSPANMGLTRHLVASLDPLGNSSRLLLPNLEHFEFKGRMLCDCRTIVDMLARRWHLSDDDGETTTKVSKLKLAEITSVGLPHLTADVHKDLRKLSEEGMSVMIMINL